MQEDQGWRDLTNGNGKEGNPLPLLLPTCIPPRTLINCWKGDDLLVRIGTLHRRPIPPRALILPTYAPKQANRRKDDLRCMI